MKKIFIIFLLSFLAVNLQAQDNTGEQKRAAEWSAALELNDTRKEERVKTLIFNHLVAVKDWHNSHPASTVPAGINPLTGQKLSELDRTIIADSAMPETVHKTLMDGLSEELDTAQVTFILDKYTIGKVDFTMKGYKAIVPDLTTEEEKVIRANLEEAREMAIDYKNMKQISAIFEIYKTKSEQYLNANGRSWRQLYKDYVNKAKAEKARKSNEK
ncbi:DUF3826 domain-containing protein [Sphingobacterium gobiense]|uniref:DUF3826 domain-containing protein n=1 Tax=Sphingobacterium gobiense TaxID=1382456 RepID=A0A2S9JLY3_9SPHI|nr:DUF3826 domain-containing protein [Sphingobacterium gobiense]PRD54157.1 hypothetical protein C5749_11770 [Sphingobacterium gobiense]